MPCSKETPTDASGMTRGKYPEARLHEMSPNTRSQLASTRMGIPATRKAWSMWVS